MNEILQKRIEEASIEYTMRTRPMCIAGGAFADMAREINKNPAFIAGANFALQNQWISVDEALPKCDRCHLAMYEDGGIIVAKYENETWWWQDGFVVGRNTEGDLMYSSSCEVPSGLITHWMEIPSLKGGEE